jgi:hypothetical protein
MDILVNNLFLDIINYDVKWLNILKLSILWIYKVCLTIVCEEHI